MAGSQEGTGNAGIIVRQGKKLRALRTKDVSCVVLVNGLHSREGGGPAPPLPQAGMEISPGDARWREVYLLYLLAP